MQDNVKHLSLIRGWLSNNNLEHYISTIEEEIAKIKGIDTSELTSLLNAGKKTQAIQLANELRQGALNERAASFASLEWLDKIIKLIKIEIMKVEITISQRKCEPLPTHRPCR